MGPPLADAQPNLRRGLMALVAGVLTFLGTWLGGGVITTLVIRARFPPPVPPPTEAYEGGDALMAAFWFNTGVWLSAVAAAFVAALLAEWVYGKLGSNED